MTTNSGSGAKHTTEKEKARVWVLFDEGCTQREICKQTGRSLTTVQRILALDPVQWQAIRAAAAEERATLWREHERDSLKDIASLTKFVRELIASPKGVRRKLSEDDRLDLALYIRAMSPFKSLAEAATIKHELLTGQPTDRLEDTTKTLDAQSMTDNQVIISTLQGSLMDRLPARLKPIALQMHEIGEIKLTKAEITLCTPKRPNPITKKKLRKRG